MPLSPLAQYSIRKLLRQSTDTLAHLFMPTTNPAGLSEVSLDRMLTKLAFQPKSKGLEVIELELLIKLHQQFENTPSNTTNLTEIKRQIFAILGFQTSTALSTDLPPIVNLDETETFCFFYDNQIQNGIRYNQEIFGAVKTFNLTARLQAYQIAWALTEAKVPIVLTRSTTDFVIWVNIQAPAYEVLLHQDTTLRTLLVLTTALRKCKLLLQHHSATLKRRSKFRVH